MYICVLVRSDRQSVCGGSSELCANPDAFLADNLQRYDCYKVLAAEEQCPAGCSEEPADNEGNRYCSCQVTDSDSCLAKLTGELSYVREVNQGVETNCSRMTVS